MRDRNRRVDAFCVCVCVPFSMALFTSLLWQNISHSGFWEGEKCRRIACVRDSAIFPAVDFTLARPRAPSSFNTRTWRKSQSASCVCECVHRLVIDRYFYISRARDAEMMMKGRRLMIYEHLLTAEGCGRAISLGEPLILYVITQTPPAEPPRRKRE